MVTHMKTTVEIGDALCEEAKSVAVEEGTTLRELIEAGLRHEIERRRSRAAFKLSKKSFRGEGLQSEFQDGSWSRMREAAYEGRGG